MAWTWKLTAVASTVDALDDEGAPTTIDLSLTGDFRATVEIRDDADALVMTKHYQFPFNVARAEAVSRISADVARVRDARARVATLTADVGATVTVP